MSNYSIKDLNNLIFQYLKPLQIIFIYFKKVKIKVKLKLTEIGFTGL